MRKLRDAQLKDFKQNRIPAGATDGSVNWIRLDNVPVTGRVQVISSKGGQASGYDCGTCKCPAGYTSTTVSQDPANEPPLVPGQTCQHTATGCFYDCNNFPSYFDISDSATWSSSDVNIATVGSTGLVTGVSGGTPTISAYYCDYTYHWNTVEQMCDPRSSCKTGSATCPVVDTFSVEYTAFIPVDHVYGAGSCFYLGNNFQLIYLGDALRGTFRTRELDNIVPDTQQSSGFSQDTGISKNYGFGSPANGSTLSAADEDGVQHDCHLWNDTGQAPKNFSYDVSWPIAHEGSVHYSGSASNPLENQAATITWDVHTSIDTTNPASPTAALSYNHTCYPAHQIEVNGQVVYLYTPPENDFGYLFDCLFEHINPVIGEKPAQVVPTH